MIKMQEDGQPTEQGWYIFQHKNTRELVVRRLGEDCVLYDIRNQRYDHAAQWREYYSGFARVYFEPYNFPAIANEVLQG